jgi:predicted Ser/Thr protein kinase
LEGLCPACLLKQGAASDTNPEPGAKPFEPPSVGEVARLFPRLEILCFLGKGGMGAVYKARQPALDRFVALKILPAQGGASPGFAERFTREARALARLSHPNIVGVHEFGQVDGLHFFVMEFVDGVNLRQLQKTGRLSPRQALEIVPQICDALQYAHDEGVVHRDIKPENVLVDRKGRVKIADFGLAKILAREKEDLRLTGEGQVMGTPHYMAPEQIEHPLEVDHRADIFSLGVVFYEMLTGELPLGKFPPPSRRVRVDVRLDEVVLHALEKEPERRYQQASEVKSAVEGITSGQSTGSPQPTGTQFAIPKWAVGIDYRSRTRLWGLPLLHVATGLDPATGRQRIATGIVAIGNVARGGLAIGGSAIGAIAFGGLAVGGIAFGGLALGVIAIGGLALALAAAFGGGAIAPIAMGGGSIGYWAYGGGGWGAHVLSGLRVDPRAWDFFQPWAAPLLHWVFVGGLMLGLGTMLVAIPVIVVLPGWLARDPRALQRPRFWCQIGLALVLAVVVAALMGLRTRSNLPRRYLITGRVTDAENGRPLAGASVTVSRLGALNPFRQSHTDTNGQFSLMPPAPGGLTIAWLMGYSAAVVTNTPGLFDSKRRARLEFKLLPSSSPLWFPPLTAGQTPDPNQIRDEANQLRDKGQYHAALERYLWYWTHALSYDPGLSAVRRSFLLADWFELARRYAPAKQELLRIRAQDIEHLLRGSGSFDLFMDLAAINGYLQDEESTYQVFEKIRERDAALAQQCFFTAEPLLVKHGDYALCLKYLGDPESAFSLLRYVWETDKRFEQRQADVAKLTEAPGFHRPIPPKIADRRFVDQTCQLILILVKTGHTKEAEHIRDEALALVADPRLKSAVSDAEKTPAPK